MSVPIIDTLEPLGSFPAVDYSKVQAGAVRLDVALSNKIEKSYVDAETAKKVDKVPGKVLSTNDYTDQDKSTLKKLDGYFTVVNV